MKYLTKRADSPILAEGITYQPCGHNERLRDMLLREQRGFCAYTEKRVDPLDSSDVEHFDPAKKQTDNYYNYYAVLHGANKRKRAKEHQHKGDAFFTTLFFQDARQLAERVRYVPSEYVYEAREGDQEAAALIDYLGFNDEALCRQRRDHVRRLRALCDDAGYGTEQRCRHLQRHNADLSFITALEAELGIDLSQLLVSTEPPAAPPSDAPRRAEDPT